MNLALLQYSLSDRKTNIGQNVFFSGEIICIANIMSISKFLKILEIRNTVNSNLLDIELFLYEK